MEKEFFLLGDDKFIHPSIHPSIHHLYHLSFEGCRGELEPTQLTLGDVKPGEVANIQTTIHTDLHNMGRTCEHHKERPGLNWEPSRCEATVLAPAPPCHPELRNLEVNCLSPNIKFDERSLCCRKWKFRPKLPGGLEPAVSGKVSQVVNEVMTRDTAVAGDLNRMLEWRAYFRPIRSMAH